MGRETKDTDNPNTLRWHKYYEKKNEPGFLEKKKERQRKNKS